MGSQKELNKPHPYDDDCFCDACTKKWHRVLFAAMNRRYAEDTKKKKKEKENGRVDPFHSRKAERSVARRSESAVGPNQSSTGS